MEISLVAIPADPHVGVGRSATDSETIEVEVRSAEPQKQESHMPENATLTAAPPAQPDAATMDRIRNEANAAERKRVAAISGVAAIWRARKPQIQKMADDAIAAGTSEDQFRADVLTMVSNADNPLTPPPPSADIGMSDRQVQQYSLRRAIMLSVDDKLDGLEREVHDEGTKRARETGLPIKGNLFIPSDVLLGQRSDGGQMALARDLLMQLQLRQQVVGTASLGGNLVATNLLAGSFIEILRNRMKVAQLGAMTLDGLVGNIAIPRQSGAQAAVWMASELATAATANLTYDQVTMSPKTLQAIRTYSRILLAQSTPSIDVLIRNDIAISIALGIDLAALHGPGTAGQPTGVASQTGVNSTLFGNGTNGADPTWAKVVAMETAIGADNADVATMAYLTDATGRGHLKTIEKASGTAQFIWTDSQTLGEGMVNGYRAAVSNQVTHSATVGSSVGNASYMFFGDWSQLMIGLWGGLDVLTDNLTLLTTRLVRVSTVQFADVAVRHGESFAVASDMETS